MREIRKSGSEGEVRFKPSFLPLSTPSILKPSWNRCKVLNRTISQHGIGYFDEAADIGAFGVVVEIALFAVF